MAKSFDKDTAQVARATAETWDMVKQSDLGKRLEDEFARIEEQAITAALSGPTPETTNILMERRGEYKAVQRMRQVFKDVEKDAKDAVTWQVSNIPQDASVKAK